MKGPLVSVIITTKNEEKNIRRCLKSIARQTYKDIEILVVDNNSSDQTVNISKEFTKNVYTLGPERSAQRNFGAKKSKGEFLLFLDADMILTKNVVEECIKIVESYKVHKELGGIFIPEMSIGESFWAKAKNLERRFYIGNHDIEAARFYRKKLFLELHGFDESLTGPEDWDLSKRMEERYELKNAKSFILHNEGNLSLFETIKTKYYYSKKMRKYISRQFKNNRSKSEINPISRFLLFFSSPEKLFKDPILGAGLLFMKSCEYLAGAVGYILS